MTKEKPRVAVRRLIGAAGKSVLTGGETYRYGDLEKPKPRGLRPAADALQRGFATLQLIGEEPKKSDMPH